MKFKTLALFSAIFMTFDVTAAEQLTIYRWVDKDNVVHFSQHQPQVGDYIEISMANNQKSAAIIDNKTPAAPEKNLAGIGSVDESLSGNENLDKCNTARDNLNTLQNFAKIQYKDEQGNIKVLGDIEKEQQLAMNKKQAEVFCVDN